MQVLIGLFKFNSESEILKGPDHSEPSVSGLPVTCVSYESESMDDDADTDSDLEAVYKYISISRHEKQSEEYRILLSQDVCTDSQEHEMIMKDISTDI